MAFLPIKGIDTTNLSNRELEGFSHSFHVEEDGIKQLNDLLKMDSNTESCSMNRIAWKIIYQNCSDVIYSEANKGKFVANIYDKIEHCNNLQKERAKQLL